MLDLRPWNTGYLSLNTYVWEVVEQHTMSGNPRRQQYEKCTMAEVL